MQDSSRTVCRDFACEVGGRLTPMPLGHDVAAWAKEVWEVFPRDLDPTRCFVSARPSKRGEPATAQQGPKSQQEKARLVEAKAPKHSAGLVPRVGF